jgi:pimeloyl-ACP methyl ester carboxylesterase
MPQHADDLAAVLEALTVPRAVVLGHSMGAFASLVLANRHRALVSGLVLVDGGLPLASPEGLSDDELTRATLGPAAERLSMVFPSREHYADFWRRHPAFADDWNAAQPRGGHQNLGSEGCRKKIGGPSSLRPLKGASVCSK